MTKKKFSNNFDYFTLFFLLLLLIFAKLFIHPPNFSPLISIIIISAFLISNRLALVSIILLSMLISDLILGIYIGMSTIHLVLIFIACSVTKLFKKINYKNLIFISFYASFIFFILTNPLHILIDQKLIVNLRYLKEVYAAGLPFFFNTLTSTILFNYIILFLIKKISNSKKFSIKLKNE